MKNIYKTLTLLSFTFLLVGCNSPEVDKNLKKNEKNVIKYVEEYIKEKHPNVEYDYNGKDTATIISSECTTQCEELKIKGGHEYTFYLTDKDGNKGYIKYIDPYTYEEENYKEQLVDTYDFIKGRTYESSRYLQIITSYLNKEDVIKSYYHADNESKGAEKKFKIIYDINLTYRNLSYKDYAALNMAAFDIWSSHEGKTDLPEIYVRFRDESHFRLLGQNGLDNNHTKEKEYDDELFDVTDTYNLKDSLNMNISAEEYNKLFNLLNNKAQYYIKKIDNIQVKGNNSKKITIIINTHTNNNHQMKVLIKTTLDETKQEYIFDEVSVITPNCTEDTCTNGRVLRKWEL